MKKAKALLTIAGLLFLTAGVLAGVKVIKERKDLKSHAAVAAKISISPQNRDLEKNQDFSFSVKLDTDTNQVTGLDLILKFDPTVFEVESVQKGNDVASLDNTITNTHDNSKGTVSYAAFTLDKTKAINGPNIEVLKVNAKTKSNATNGNYFLTFDPSTAASAVNETQNALTDKISGTVNIKDSSSTTGQPNSCGGTCGSNINCATNLYCFIENGKNQGYCRNPSCSSSTDCSCNQATTAPTTRPTARPTTAPITKGGTVTTAPLAYVDPTTVSSPRPTPKLNNFWEDSFNDVTPTDAPDLGTTELPENQKTNFLPWIIGSLVIAGIALVLIVIGIYKQYFRKPKPPVINM